MRILALACLSIACALAQAPPAPRASYSDASGSNLPAQKIGPNDLVSVSVYDSPEFSRTVRVGGDGSIALPMMKNPIPAAGLMPAELEAKVAEALREEHLLREPSVVVTVSEYNSRPITVSGSVRSPLTFQAIGTVHLMDAITRAGGLAPDAGPEALVTTTQPGKSTLVRRVPLKGLIDASDPELNIPLEGGEEVRIPGAGRIFVLGNVKNSNSFPIQDEADTTVLKVLALAGGFSGSVPKEAFIIRLDEVSRAKHEIPIQMKNIVDRKTADVPLLANDILYVPENNKARNTKKALEIALTLAMLVTGAMIYTAIR